MLISQWPTARWFLRVLVDTPESRSDLGRGWVEIAVREALKLKLEVEEKPYLTFAQG